MENRLELNKKPKYELPDEVEVGLYVRHKKEPPFKPDICITNYARNIKIDTVVGRTVEQIWIKTNNKELLEFIYSFNWNSVIKSAITSARHLTLPLFKKVLLEEFYEVKYGE